MPTPIPAGDAAGRGSSRLDALDLCRSLIAVTMALTHAAYLLWVGAREPSFLFWHGPFVSDERWPEAAIRLLSGACSSGFFILMGAGISLYAHARREAGWNWPAIRRHFAIRGLVLMVLQFGVENMLWSLKPGESWFNYVGVLYALGISMAVAGALSRWSSAALGILSLGLILLPEITAPVFRGRESSLPPAIALTILAGKSAGLNIYFPALPWLGLTTGGLLLGRLFLQRPRQAWRLAGSLGAGLIGAALLLRWNGGTGTLGVVEGRGWIGFLTFVKYSPSLAYVAWNAGLILVSLPVFNRVAQALPGWTRLGVIYGRSSLFFYLAHLVIYAGLSRILGPPGQGLPVVLLCWAAGLLILWPMCRWYFQFKRSTPLDSWWRLF